MKFRYIEKYECRFNDFALHECDHMWWDNDNLWACVLPENKSKEYKSCNPDDCPLCYREDIEKENDSDTVIIYRDLA